MSNESEDKKSISIEVPTDAEKGTYSNLCIITHSQSEFIVDFAQIFVGQAKPKVRSRIIMTPDNAKRLLLALQDNVNKFEQSFGTIQIGTHDKTPNSHIPPITPFGSGEA